jgi:hypothetical protein
MHCFPGQIPVRLVMATYRRLTRIHEGHSGVDCAHSTTGGGLDILSASQ